MKIGIDLLWVRPGKNGGTESYIRNLLDGLVINLPEDMEICLFVSKDNYESFNKYIGNGVTEVICDINSANVGKRILWQNLKFNKVIKNSKIDIFFEPVYSKPFINVKGIKYITVIHDLQALHFPQYFSKLKCIWLKLSWKLSCITSNKIIAISKFVKEDIAKRLKVNEREIEVIYNPISLEDDSTNFDVLEKKYNIYEKDFFYTVSSMLPHKNLKTILLLIKEIKEKKLDLPNKLVISGIGGNEEEFNKLINELGIVENIIITGYISNEDRNSLYENCHTFLFPSIFEGFGMPPVEALMKKCNVVTTKETCLYEVTKGKATYINNPYNIEEWINSIFKSSKCEKLKNYYNKDSISKDYIMQFKEVMEA